MSLTTPPHWIDTATIEQMSDGYVALDRTWRYTYVNVTAAQLMDLTPEDLLGREIWSVFPELPQQIREHLQQAMNRQEPVEIETHYEPLSRWVRLAIVPTTEGVSIYAHDDTAQRRSAALRQQLLALNSALAADGHVHEIARAILAVAIPGTLAQGGLIALLDASGDTLQIIQWDGYPTDLTAPWHELPMHLRLPLTDAQRSAQPLYLSEAQIRSDYPALNAGAGARSLVCLPLLVSGTSIGVLGLSFAAAVSFDEDQRLYLSMLASYAAQAMQRSQHHEQARIEVAQQHLLLASTGIMLWSADPQMHFDERNRAWLEFTGRTAAESSLLALPGVLHPEDRDAVLAQADAGVRSGRPFVMSGRVLRRDGVYRNLESHVEPVRDPGGTLTGWIGVLRDVTERERTATFEAARQRVLDALPSLGGHAALLAGLCGEGRALTGAERVTLWQWHPEHEELRVLASSGAGAQVPEGFSQQLMTGHWPASALSVLGNGDETELWYVQTLPVDQTHPERLAGDFGLLYRSRFPLHTEVQQLMAQLSRTLRVSLERALALQHLEARDSLYHTIVESLHEGVLVIEGDHFRPLNPSVRHLLLLPEASQDEWVSRTLTDWQFFTPQGERLKSENSPVNRSVRGEQVLSQLINARHTGGTSAWWLMNATPLQATAGGTRVAVVTLSDVTAQTALQRQLEYQVSHDPLTGLHNRRAFMAYVDGAATQARISGGCLAVLQLGVDHFKAVSDVLGQQVGDELLQVIARRLLELLQGQGMAASLAGDEFGVALPVASVTEGRRLGDQLLRAVSQPMSLLEHEVAVTGSAGLTFAPVDGLTAQALLPNADMSMYRAKRGGRNAVAVYDDVLGQAHHRRREIEGRLRHAARRGELKLVYQPVVALHDGNLRGAEALARWTSADLGAISPAEFIPIAEDSGHIIELGAWILDQAARQTMLWSGDFGASFRVSVNVSAVQFAQESFLGRLEEALGRSGLPASRLDLELTETAVMSDFELARSKLEKLKARGIRVSLDDFGTGHSSLSVLDALPFDRIKLDRSFVWGMDTSQKRRKVVHSVVAMASELDVEVVAEGIETADQLGTLVDLGCTLGQGHLFSPPVDPQRLTERYGGFQTDSA